MSNLQEAVLLPLLRPHPEEPRGVGASRRISQVLLVQLPSEAEVVLVRWFQHDEVFIFEEYVVVLVRPRVLDISRFLSSWRSNAAEE